MEESPDAHMETDVSFTTEDSQEAQEVTGSNGNVEMVVIVEKVTDDESTCGSNDQGIKQSMVSDCDMVRDSNREAPQASPQKAAPEPISGQPPKHTEAQKSPKKQEHSNNKEPIGEKTGNASPSLFQSEETVDILSKVDVQQSPKKSITPKKQSPFKDAQAEKTPHSSPEQLQMAQETIMPSPKKVTTPEKLNGNVENSSNEKEELDSSQSMPKEVPLEKEASNDSQMETNSDISEKEHNKSISRELKSLIKSAKESKIISECTQLTTKTRKSRVPLETSNSSLNVSLEADKIHDVRRSSINSQKSNCSEKSEKVPVKRSMRSQNPEFVNKVKQFLNSVTSKVQKELDGADDNTEETKLKDINNESSPILVYTNKKKKEVENVDQNLNSNKLKSDPFCWRCHWAVEQAANEKIHPPLVCTICPRSFHYKCLNGAERSKISVDKSWVCPECMAILHAESSETRSLAMKKISLGALCDLLMHALERMMDLNGVEPFMQPVDRSLFPDYDKYVIHPMDLMRMKSNINEGVYGSTEAFIADTQWILHNSIIFNTCEQGFVQSKLTASARTLVRSCRAEMGAIEACPECYAAAHARKPTWFTDVCTTPHMLLWAKLKGFPYWPAKGMSVNNSGLVDVRFFGAHDRAWVPAKDCFLYSEKDPNNFRTKRQDILDSMQEAEQHIRNISRKYGKFVYPPFKTQFDPSKLTEQLKMMIPTFEGEVRVPVKEKHVVASPILVKDKRSSKSSKSSFNDGEYSEAEDGSNVSSRKMADGADIARLEDDAAEKDKTMEVDVKDETDKRPEKTSRKRRRSEMEEAADITIMSSHPKEKKKKVNTETDNKANGKTESQTPATSSKEEKFNAKESEAKDKIATPPVKSKDNEPSSSTTEKDKEPPKVTPIRLVISANQKRVVAKTTGRGSPKVLPIRIKQTKLDKSIIITKIKSNTEKSKSQKRRNSKGNKSLNSTTSSTSEKSDKPDKKSAETEISIDTKEIASINKNKEDANKSTSEKANTSKTNTVSQKTKERIQFDDDTCLAEIARGANKTAVTNSNVHGLPTISSVRSLSSNAQSTSTTTPKCTTSGKMIEVTIEPNSDNSLLIPTSSVNVRNAKETAKMSELSMVGRVGVRAFARMTSPESQRSKEVEVEIKAEPMDFEDQLEKIDMMKAFRLRPVNQASQPSSSLREVRINKVLMTPLNARKTATKPVEVRPRARKTFPQPKKPDEGRSELNSKNSMVYIPIQPPMTPGPMRGRTTNANGPVSSTPGPRPTAPIITSTLTANNIVNTATTPLVPSSVPPLINVTPTSVVTSTVIANPLPLVQVGQVPNTVHRVPLITSVNGQWTFSLQPIMSVGGLDDSPPPLLNGLPERNPPMNIQALPSGPSSIPTVISPPTVVPVPGPAVIVTNTSNVAMPALAPTSIVSPGAKVTEFCTTNHGEPPRLLQRPLMMNPLDAQMPAGTVPPPSSVGPATAKLNQNAVKLTDFFRTLLEDSIEKLDDPSTQVTTLRLKIEQMQWRHQQEVDEMKHNHELVLAEMRTSFEKDKARLTTELRRVAQTEQEAAVKQAKNKQWCANCYQEAQFYCCWNTSYCDYPCQRAHWAHHYALCTQQRPGDAANNPNDAPGSRLQPQPDNLPKCTMAPSATPALTVGGKLARPLEPPVSKPSSIIMSMIEDKSGNQTMKCVGVYKPPTAPPPITQIAPLVINNQVINNEDTTNKMMTSGGYLIVGGNNTANQVTTPPRRTHTIQYYT